MKAYVVVRLPSKIILQLIVLPILLLYLHTLFDVLKTEYILMLLNHYEIFYRHVLVFYTGQIFSFGTLKYLYFVSIPLLVSLICWIFPHLFSFLEERITYLPFSWCLKDKSKRKLIHAEKVSNFKSSVRNLSLYLRTREGTKIT